MLKWLRACAESVLTEYQFVKTHFAQEETDLYKKSILIR